MTIEKFHPEFHREAEEAVARFRLLIETRSFKKEQLADHQVISDLERLAWAAADAPHQLRLDTLSVLGKAAEVSKPIADAVRPLMMEALHKIPPQTGTWGNADDRYYLAKAVSTCQDKWIGLYAARELAEADTSEQRSREVWAELALTHCANIAEAIREVDTRLRQGKNDGPDAQLATFRRLTRICEALLKPLLSTNLQSGSELGSAFRSLIGLTGLPSTFEFKKAREAAAIAAMDMVVTVLRIKFDALFDPDMYRAVSAPLKWWHPATPPATVQERLDRAAALAVEALYVVAKQGIKDTELRRSMSATLGSERIDLLSSRKAEADPSLDPDISHWLTTGRALQTAPRHNAIEEILDRDLDELIARMVIERNRFDLTPAGVRKISGAIEAFEPVHASSITSIANYLDVVSQSIETIARKRGIVLSPARDEKVKYDPRLHEASHPIVTSTEVKVLLPGALKATAGRPSSVLIKAIVE